MCYSPQGNNEELLSAASCVPNPNDCAESPWAAQPSSVFPPGCACAPPELCVSQSLSSVQTWSTQPHLLCTSWTHCWQCRASQCPEFTVRCPTAPFSNTQWCFGAIFKFNLDAVLKKKRKMVLQALFYGKNSSSKNKSFLLKLEPEA